MGLVYRDVISVTYWCAKEFCNDGTTFVPTGVSRSFPIMISHLLRTGMPREFHLVMPSLLRTGAPGKFPKNCTPPVGTCAQPLAEA